jgi:hypothetical protein
MNQILTGAIVAGYAVAGLFFFKFWRETHDRLFAMFAMAFWILSVNYLLLTPTQNADEVLPLHYTVRAFAFLLILAGIIDKNYSKRRK